MNIFNKNKKKSDDTKVIFQKFDKHYDTYLQILMDYRGEQGWTMNADEDSKHTIPFILTCAAALECSLNDHLISHFSSRYHDGSKDMIIGYLGMSLRGKLVNIIPLLSKFKLRINQEHKTFKALTELISIRNKITHNKSSYETMNMTQDDLDNFDFNTLKALCKTKRDFSMNIRGDIGRFQDALEDLHERYLEAYCTDAFMYGTGEDFNPDGRELKPEPSDLIQLLVEDIVPTLTMMPE